MNRLGRIILILASLAIAQASLPCARQDTGRDSFICVCNKTYCDTFDPIQDRVPRNGLDVLTVTTSRDGLRFHEEFEKFSQHPTKIADIKVTLDMKRTYQEIIGFGGSFTDATGYNVFNLPLNLSQRLLADYYGPHGLEYNMGRVNMGGCDFSARKYALGDVPGDFNLEHWSLAYEDVDLKIPMIKIAEKAAGRPLKIFGSPWAPPGWMKTSGDIKGPGELKGLPGGPYYKSWAKNLVKFLKAYEERGVQLWGMTAQNEPLTGYEEGWKFNALGMTPDLQREFVKRDLGPALVAANYTKDKFQLMIWDHNKRELEWFVHNVLKDKDIDQYVTGIAIHWYFMPFDDPIVLERIHEQYPSYFILGTEACNGFRERDIKEKVSLGNWTRAEMYASDIIHDLNRYAAGWIDWNLALDVVGGPNWVQNFVDAPIIVEATKDTYYKQPMYYALGHFSKFIPEGSKRVHHEIKSNDLKVYLTTFLTPQGNMVLVAQNREPKNVSITVFDPDLGHLFTTLPPYSIKSYAYRKS